MLSAIAQPEATDRAAWTYASGLSRALEGRLLDHRATLDLLAGAGLGDLLARIRQSVLFADLPEAAAPFALANHMDSSFAATVRRLREACPTPELATAFLLPFHWEAFRSHLRARVVGREPRAFPACTVPEAVWERCWTTLDVEPPFAPFAAAARNIRDKMPREKHDERLVDEITAAYKTRHITRIVRRLGNASVTEWITAWLKLRLALELLRCSLNGWPHIRIADALDDFGVGKADIMGLATPERPDWRTPFRRLGLPAVESIPEAEPRPTIALDRLIDDRMTEWVRAARGVPFGPEPVGAFLWALRIEWVNLKLIATGVAAGLPRDAIATDIRQTYV